MKPTSRILFLFFVTALLLLNTGCEKRPFDYRNQLIGDYDITCVKSWIYIFNQTSGSTTENSTGKVSYKKDEKGKMRLQLQNTTIILQVNKKGEVIMCGKPTGKFTDNSFSFYYDSCGSDGHGGSGTIKYSGTKL